MDHRRRKDIPGFTTQGKQLCKAETIAVKEDYSLTHRCVCVYVCECARVLDDVAREKSQQTARFEAYRKGQQSLDTFYKKYREKEGWGMAWWLSWQMH